MAQLNDNQADKMKGKAVLYKGSLFSVDELVYSGNLSDDPTVDNNDGESDFEDDASDNELDDPSERNSSDAVGSGSIAQQVVGGSVGGSAALGTTSATTSTTGAQTNGVKKTNKTPPQSKTKGKGRKPAIPKTIDRPMKYTKRPRPKNNIYKASPELQWLKTRGVAAAMKKYHLTIHKDCRETPILDTTPKNPQGLKQYRSIACGLEFFFAMIGDFESCLIMQPKQFDQVVPAMNPESIQLFLKWKSGVAGEPLTRSNGDPVFDVFGEALIRTGAWKDANSGQQVYATVAAIHKNRGHPRNMPYVEQCLPCFNLMDSRGSSGCQDHRANPRPKRTGNARFSTVAMDGLKNLKAELSAHAPNGDSPLLPHELLKWRKYLMDKGSFWSSQQWVMSLLASKLGLRMDELCKIQMKHIHLAVSPVVQAPNGKVVVHGLCFEIQGKTDTHPVYLIAWADFENPELDPVRHVLAHIHQLDCKGGFLFPSKLEWERFKATQPADGIIRDRISDNDFMEEIREGLHHVFGAAEFQDPSEFQAVANDELPQPYMPQMVDRPRIFGTHTFRKTYFLLAAFSQASDIDMALGARHKTMNTSMRYKEDNATLLEIWRQCGQDTGLKMVWKSIYLGQTTTARAIIDNPFKHPLDLAKAFCVRNCGIRLDNCKLTGLRWHQYFWTRILESLNQDSFQVQVDSLLVNLVGKTLSVGDKDALLALLMRARIEVEACAGVVEVEKMAAEAAEQAWQEEEPEYESDQDEEYNEIDDEIDDDGGIGGCYSGGVAEDNTESQENSNNRESKLTDTAGENIVETPIESVQESGSDSVESEVLTKTCPKGSSKTTTLEELTPLVQRIGLGVLEIEFPETLPTWHLERLRAMFHTSLDWNTCYAGFIGKYRSLQEFPSVPVGEDKFETETLDRVRTVTISWNISRESRMTAIMAVLCPFFTMDSPPPEDLITNPIAHYRDSFFKPCKLLPAFNDIAPVSSFVGMEPLVSVPFATLPQQTLPETASTSKRRLDGSSSAQEPVLKKPKRSQIVRKSVADGGNDLEGLTASKLKGLSLEELIIKFRQLRSSFDTTSELTTRAQGFWARHVHPTLHCLDQHCSGNVSVFLSRMQRHDNHKKLVNNISLSDKKVKEACAAACNTNQETMEEN